jgi:hypothetical protein
MPKEWIQFHSADINLMVKDAEEDNWAGATDEHYRDHHACNRCGNIILTAIDIFGTPLYKELQSPTRQGGTLIYINN